MSEEFKDALIECEKEPEVKFSIPFKLILAISICVTGLVTLIGILFFISGSIDKMWSTNQINIFLYDSLFFISTFCCFISLIGIAVIKKPFSKILVWCTMIIGVLILLSAFMFPRFKGYNCNFTLYSKGSFILADGKLFMIGILGILFSMVIKYGFIYQKRWDTTI
ncbi:hypothetical protein [Ruminiclostridium cellobioparum]|jgi:hypothetical protein|uniref:hypothetical protein n=1 Tax=Ruminiclostridium cellobioparum TaxID=29355 RepID=UPI000487E4EA|nr:hypothetical protein [Ruminiclostridium cellobioparum]